MENADTILPLIYKHLQGSLTDEEAAVLANWLAAAPQRQALLKDLNDDQLLQEQLWVNQPANWATVEAGITAKLQERISAAQPAGRFVRMQQKWWLAASVLLLLGIGAYLWFRPGTNNNGEVIVSGTPERIEAGKNGAVLTLADGRQVVLDSLGNGIVAEQQGTQVIMKNGNLVYDIDQQAPVAATAYNTMSTPRGRQFRITLPDGTGVWLNAGSSIRYPTQFNGSDRVVYVTGEIYFEVAKNAGKPFYVSVNDATRVAVLGTSFNINAYDNEPSIGMTLVEGKIRVMTNNENVTLAPGKQARVTGTDLKVLTVDTDQVIAWKSGLFNLNDLPFQAIMRQIERWYDVDVEYENGVPDLPLVGEISRDVPLQGLLKNLERLGMQYRLEGRKLIIMGNR